MRARLLGAALIIACNRPSAPVGPPIDLVTFEGVSWTASRRGTSITGAGVAAQLSRNTGAFTIDRVAVTFPRGLQLTATELEGQLSRRGTPLTFKASGSLRLALDGGLLEAERAEYRPDGILLSEAPVSGRVESRLAVAEHRGRGFEWDTVSGRVTVHQAASRFEWTDGGRSTVTADELSFTDQLGEATYRGHVSVEEKGFLAGCKAVRAPLDGSAPLTCVSP